MTAEVARELLAEIEELVSIGPVGLYEFVWTLREIAPGLGDDDRITLSAAVLRDLLAQPGHRLVWEVWAHPELTRPAENVMPGREHWADPEKGIPFLALEVA